MTMLRAIVTILILTALGVTQLDAQTIESLRRDMERAKREIEQTNKQLQSARTQQRSSEKVLGLLRNKIQQRNRIISSLSAQGRLVERDVSLKSHSVGELQQQVGELKKEYAAMLYDAYKHHKLNNYLSFVFAAKDFNDVFRRIYYLKQYTLVRERKAHELERYAEQLNGEISQLNRERVRLDSLRQLRNNEVRHLAADESEQKHVISQLKTTQKTLSKTLKAKQTIVANLQRKISQIIAEEARKAREKNRKSTPAQKEAYHALSGQFDKNRGRLPYPVSGRIVEGFGVHAHVDQKSLIVDNKGVNIRAAAGATVKAVFDGEVTRVFFFRGMNNTVMVRHGNYLTVYSNLEQVSVKNGQKVSLGQTLGTLSGEGNSELHFEIWRETTNLNPQQWLRP